MKYFIKLLLFLYALSFLGCSIGFAIKPLNLYWLLSLIGLVICIGFLGIIIAIEQKLEHPNIVGFHKMDSE